MPSKTYVHLKAQSRLEKHGPSCINKILMSCAVISQDAQLGNSVVYVHIIQSASGALNHTRDGGAFFCSLHAEE